MPARLHPGVYVEEVSGGARSIEAAGTSTAIFVGETARGPLEPTLIKSRSEFERLFGGYSREFGETGLDAAATAVGALPLPYAMDGFFQNGGQAAYILRAITEDAATALRTLPNGRFLASSPGEWANGRLAAVLCASSDGDTGRFRLVVLFSPGSREPQIVESWDRLSANPVDESFVNTVLARSLYLRWEATGAGNTVPPLDIPKAHPSESELMALARGAAGLSGGVGGRTPPPVARYEQLLRRLDEVDDASLLVLPGLTGDYANVALAYVEARPRRDLFYIADLPRNEDEETTGAVRKTLGFFRDQVSPKTDCAAVYWPWIEVSDPAGAGPDPTVIMPPSGHLAGLYARTDARRGIWKAPAGVEASLLGVRALQFKVLDAHQDDLNPLGINALRVVPAGGIVSWGARTLRPASQWRYVPVRRTAMFLRKSIYDGIQWAVFEPNDEPLWASLRVNVGAFMEQQFRQGAFAGRTSREAYFVKCDAETNTEADQAAGIVNLWVGFAPLRPAEFVVVKLSQKVNQPS